MNCFMIALSDNMWNDSPTRETVNPDAKFTTKLRTQKDVWDEVTAFAVKSGCDSVLIDLGDGVKYKSHPEIAVEGAWEPEYLKQELARLRSIGLTPYPKLNFSAGHDAWLGIYGRMLSTPIYYQVVKDLIHEVIDIFDTPALFHLGLDEENGLNQQKLTFACYRQFELIWHDLNFYFDCVREKGSRPWIWPDYFWTHEQEFADNVPRDVLLSPWCYGYFYPDVSAPLPSDPWSTARFASFKKLSDLGFDILPCGSNHANTYNFNHILRWTREQVAPEHNMGLLITVWQSTTDKYRYDYLSALQLAKYARMEVFGGCDDVH